MKQTGKGWGYLKAGLWKTLPNCRKEGWDGAQGDSYKYGRVAVEPLLFGELEEAFVKLGRGSFWKARFTPLHPWKTVEAESQK